MAKGKGKRARKATPSQKQARPNKRQKKAPSPASASDSDSDFDSDRESPSQSNNNRHPLIRGRHISIAEARQMPGNSLVNMKAAVYSATKYEHPLRMRILLGDGTGEIQTTLWNDKVASVEKWVTPGVWVSLQGPTRNIVHADARYNNGNTKWELRDMTITALLRSQTDDAMQLRLDAVKLDQLDENFENGTHGNKFDLLVSVTSVQQTTSGKCLKVTISDDTDQKTVLLRKDFAELFAEGDTCVLKNCKLYFKDSYVNIWAGIVVSPCVANEYFSAEIAAFKKLELKSCPQLKLDETDFLPMSVHKLQQKTRDGTDLRQLGKYEHAQLDLSWVMAVNPARAIYYVVAGTNKKLSAKDVLDDSIAKEARFLLKVEFQCTSSRPREIVLTFFSDIATQLLGVSPKDFTEMSDLQLQATFDAMVGKKYRMFCKVKAKRYNGAAQFSFWKCEEM